MLNYFVAFSLTLHSSFVPLSAGTGDLLVEPDMFQAPQPPPNGDVLRRQHEVKILVCNLKIKLFDWCVWGQKKEHSCKYERYESQPDPLVSNNGF